MLEKYNVRTDLALEEKERFESDQVEIPGVILEEEYEEELEIQITKVKIETENGAKSMGKPVGVYLTIEAPNMAMSDEDYHREISEKLARKIGEIIHLQEKEICSILVVGLGNRQVTPDALGPDVVDNLREKGIKAGLLKIRVFRPFPAEEIAKALENVKAVAVLDKADSLNAAGGALFEDVTSAMYVNKKQVPMVNYVYGIGGRDTKADDIESVYNDLAQIAKTGEIDNPYRYLGLRK